MGDRIVIPDIFPPISSQGYQAPGAVALRDPRAPPEGTAGSPSPIPTMRTLNPTSVADFPAMSDPGYQGPTEYLQAVAGEQDMLAKLREVIPDPEEEAKLRLSVYMADHLGVQDPLTVYHNFDAVSEQFFGLRESPLSNVQRVQQNWARNQALVEAAKIGTDLMLHPEDNHLWDQYWKVVNAMPAEPDTRIRALGQGGLWDVLSQPFIAVAGMAPYVGDILKGNLAGKALGGAIGAGIGSVIPGAGTAAGAALGLKIGGPIGAGLEAWRLTAGGIFTDIMTAEDPESGKPLYQVVKDRQKLITVARTIAGIGGALSASIDAIQLQGLLGGGMLSKVLKRVAPKAFASRSLAGIALRFLGRGAVNITEQTVQEIAQESLEQASRDLAVAIENDAEGKQIPLTTRQQYFELLTKTAITTALATSVMGLPGAAIESALEGRTARAERGAAASGEHKTAAVPELPAAERAAAASVQVETLRTRADSLMRSFEEDPRSVSPREIERADIAVQEAEAAKDLLQEQPATRDLPAAPWQMRREVWLARPEPRTELAAQLVATIEAPTVTEATADLLTDQERTALAPVRENIRKAFADFDEGTLDVAALYLQSRAQAAGQSLESYAPVFRAAPLGDTRFEGKRGAFTTEQIEGAVRSVIYATQAADFTTYVHELSHGEWGMLDESERRTVREYAASLGERHPDYRRLQSGELDQDTYEQEVFAGAVERYLSDQVAPRGSFGEIVRRVGELIRQVYRRITSRLPDLSPEMRRLLDRHFGVDTQAMASELTGGTVFQRQREATDVADMRVEARGPGMLFQPAPDMPQAKAMALMKANEVPEGWYVHGRYGRNDLNTGHVILFSLDWEVAKGYAGKTGSVWIGRPASEDIVFDARDAHAAQSVANMFFDQYEAGELPYGAEQIARAILEATDGDREVAVDNFAAQLNPDDIVDSAMFWDGGADEINWFYEATQKAFIKTNNGAVALDEHSVAATMVAASDILFQPGAGSEHEQSVREAVESGQPVPDEVLQDYQDREWAREEISYRTSLKDEARAASAAGLVGNDPQAFALYMADQTLAEDLRSPEYYAYIWQQAQLAEGPEEVRLANERFVGTLSRENLEILLRQVSDARQKSPELAGQTIPAPLQKAVDALSSAGELAPSAYKELLSAIQAAPATFRVALDPFLLDDERTGQRAIEAEVEPDEQAVRSLAAEYRERSAAAPALRKKIDSIMRQLEGAKRAAEKARRTAQELEQSLRSADARHEAEVQALRSEYEEKLRQAKAEERARLKEHYEARISRLREQYQRWRKAAVQKERERIRARLDRQKNLAKTRQYIQKLVKAILRPPSGAVNYAQALQIRTIQQDLLLHDSPRRRKMIRRLRKWIAEHPGEKLSPEDEAWLTQRSISDMTVDELEQLKAKIDGLRETGRRALEAKRLDRLRKATDDAKAIRDDNSPGGFKPREDWGSKESKKAVRGSTWSRIKAATHNMLRIAEALGPTASRILTDVFNETRDAELRAMDRLLEPARAKMKELGITPRLLGKEIVVNGKTFTHQDALAFYVYSQNDDAWHHLTAEKGHNLDGATLFRAIAQLTPQEKAFGEYMLSVFEGDNWERLNAAYIEDTNQSSQKVEKYFPIRTSDVTRADIFLAELRTDLSNRTGTRRAYPSKSFMKLRQKKAATKIRLDAVNLFFQQIEKQEHYIATWSATKHAQRVFSDPQVREAIARRFGEKHLEAIQIYLNEASNPSALRAHEMGGKLMNAIRGNLVISALAFNYGTFLNQLTGPLLYLGDAGPVHLLSATAQWATGPKKLWEFVTSRDPQIKYRKIDEFHEQLKRIDGGAYHQFLRTVGEIGLKPLEAVDLWTTLIGWKAVYDANVKELGEAGAIKAAQKATLRTQPSAHGKDVPAIYHNEAAKMFLMFSRQLNQIWNMMTGDWPRFAKQGAVLKILADAFGLALTGWIMGLIKRKRLQDGWKEWTLDLAGQYVSGIPYVGTEVMSALYGYGTRGVALLQVGKTAAAAGKLFREDLSLEQKANALLGVIPDVARTLGVPVKPLTVALDVFEGLRNGDLSGWDFLGGPPDVRKE